MSNLWQMSVEPTVPVFKQMREDAFTPSLGANCSQNAYFWVAMNNHGFYAQLLLGVTEFSILESLKVLLFYPLFLFVLSQSQVKGLSGQCAGCLLSHTLACKLLWCWNPFLANLGI